MLTPRQRMSSLVHLVTQLMSTTQSRAGNAMNVSHDHRAGSRTRPSIENDQRSSDVRGVGPADRTGKSVVRYWPGGIRSETLPGPAGARRPTNPRVTNCSVMGILPVAERQASVARALGDPPAEEVDLVRRPATIARHRPILEAVEDRLGMRPDVTDVPEIEREGHRSTIR